jgi:hypothetical protein
LPTTTCPDTKLCTDIFSVIHLPYITQELGSDGSLKGASSLANLSALLTLQRAEEVYGFVPEQYGLTEAEAADIAGVFVRFDMNEDGQLEASELRRLW